MGDKENIIIGTRGSELALWQAHHLQSELKSLGNTNTELSIIKTKGDQIQHLSFDKIEGKGFFTKEIESALLEGEIDIAVHSLKDMPTDPTEGLVLAGLSYREDPSDLLIIKKSSLAPGKLLGIQENAIIGTSSVRRKTQLQNLFPSIQLKDLRGNVPTRIDKLRTQDYDAIVLASAGVNRLGLDLSEFHCVRLNPIEFVPAPGQGIMAYQCRKDDLKTRKLLDQIHHREVAACSNVERTILKMMDGGCHSPLGAYCEKDSMGYYHVYAAYAKVNGDKLIHCSLSQSTTHLLAEKIVEKLKTDH